MKRWQRRERTCEIHAVAHLALTQARHDVDFKRYYDELEALKEDHSGKPGNVWIEAMVMLCAAFRKRPARTLGLMRRLHQRHADKGTEAEFDGFEAMLMDALAPDRLTSHGYGQTFADLDHADIWTHLRTVVAALEEAGHRVFLNSGTLLGVVRDGKLIEHDDDLDLAVELKAGTQKDAAREWIAIRDLLEEMDLFDHAASDNEAIHKLTSKEIDGKLVEIDLFPLWFEEADDGTRAWLYPHTTGQLTRDDIFPLQTCGTTGLSLPAQPEKMLAQNYGEGWQQPDPLWRFDWKSANASFAAFRKGLKPLRKRKAPAEMKEAA